MRKGTKFLATFLAMAVLSTTVVTNPVSAKTTKFYYTESRKDYEKDAKGKWNISYLSKEQYNKKGFWTGYEYVGYNSKGKKDYSGKTEIKFNRDGTMKSSA